MRAKPKLVTRVYTKILAKQLTKIGEFIEYVKINDSKFEMHTKKGKAMVSYELSDVGSRVIVRNVNKKLKIFNEDATIGNTIKFMLGES